MTDEQRDELREQKIQRENSNAINKQSQVLNSLSIHNLGERSELTYLKSKRWVEENRQA